MFFLKNKKNLKINKLKEVIKFIINKKANSNE